MKEKKELRMRPIEANDIYEMSEILKKIGIKDSVKNDVIEKFSNPKEVKGKDSMQVGLAALLELLLSALTNLKAAKTEINKFLGDLVGITGEEFGKLPLGEYLKVIKQFKDQPDFKDFFQSVSGLMK